MPKERGTDGQFAVSVSDDDILFFFETGERPFYGTGEVAEEFDLSNTQARRRLDTLHEKKAIQKIRMDDRRTVWWRQRDFVALKPEDQGYSAHDTVTGTASGGDSRADALRNLAEAIEAAETAGTEADPTVYDELDLDEEASGSGNPFL